MDFKIGDTVITNTDLHDIRNLKGVIYNINKDGDIGIDMYEEDNETLKQPYRFTRHYSPNFFIKVDLGFEF
ncbi:MAG: hypothetical protein ACRCX2_13275 [Paraclostridium sp.]